MVREYHGALVAAGVGPVRLIDNLAAVPPMVSRETAETGR